jgi:hypothetical protein
MPFKRSSQLSYAPSGTAAIIEKDHSVCQA